MSKTGLEAIQVDLSYTEQIKSEYRVKIKKYKVLYLMLYSIMKTDRLFFEFFNEVYKEKILIKDFSLTDKDFNIFFEHKKEQSDKVASWEEYTFYKLKQVYLRILLEAGFIKNQKGKHEIVKPIIEENLVKHLMSIGDEIYLKVLMGEI
jgi:hypothetical protein